MLHMFYSDRTGHYVLHTNWINITYSRHLLDHLSWVHVQHLLASGRHTSHLPKRKWVVGSERNLIGAEE